MAARPTKEFEEKYGGTNFNAAQWIGRAYVDQKIALEKRKKKIAGRARAAGVRRPAARVRASSNPGR